MLLFGTACICHEGPARWDAGVHRAGGPDTCLPPSPVSSPGAGHGAAGPFCRRSSEVALDLLLQPAACRLVRERSWQLGSCLEGWAVQPSPVPLAGLRVRGHQYRSCLCGLGRRGWYLPALPTPSCSVTGCVRFAVMKSIIMQPVFLDEASCLHIDSYAYKYCEFLHGFISLASNSTITANLLDFQSSKNIFPGARCLAKNIPREFQELLFSVATFADVCTHPPSCEAS